MKQSIGTNFDDPDKLFNWMHDAYCCAIISTALWRGGVLDELLKGPVSVAEIAQRCSLNTDKLTRVLDFLVGHEIVAKQAGGKFAPTDRTRMLHSAAGTLAAMETEAFAGSKLLPAMREEGVTPFQLHFGEPVFPYFTSNAAAAVEFGAHMSFMTMRDMRFVFANHEFKPFKTVADIGGSMGDLLLGLLSKYPDAEGILFDLPDVVEIARPAISSSPAGGRVSIIGGSFFEAVPSADLYTLKQILHDWNDDECRQILGSIRKAINPQGRLAVIDHLLGETPQPNEAQSTDIAMLIWDTGRERKQSDFEALFADTGFKLDRITRNPNGHSVIEAIPV